MGTSWSYAIPNRTQVHAGNNVPHKYGKLHGAHLRQVGPWRAAGVAWGAAVQTIVVLSVKSVSLVFRADPYHDHEHPDLATGPPAVGVGQHSALRERACEAGVTVLAAGDSSLRKSAPTVAVFRSFSVMPTAPDFFQPTRCRRRMSRMHLWARSNDNKEGLPTLHLRSSYVMWGQLRTYFGWSLIGIRLSW